nr:MAG TPA: hypothetical protein [Ackermannviridae sp.]
MGIYVKKTGNQDIGAIKLVDSKTDKLKDINAVFWKNMMIWPRDSKYLFWSSNNKNHDFISADSDFDRNGIHVSAASHIITVYVRSCVKYWHGRYPFKVVPYQNWVTAPNIVYPIGWNIKTAEKHDYDALFDLNISGNVSTSSSRTTYVSLWQIDSKDEQINTSTSKYSGKQIVIKIVQDKDEEDPNARPSYANAIITWYKDETFSDEVKEYGTESNPYVDVNGKSISLYCNITGTVKMMSGNTARCFYGDHYGDVITINELNIDKNAMSLESSEYLGDGNWKIDLKMKSNVPTSANYKNVIRDLALSSNRVDHTGDIVTMTWKVFNEANTLTRYSNVGFLLNRTYTSTTKVWQEGGSVSNQVTNVTCATGVSKEVAKWISISRPQINSATSSYYAKVTVNPQTATEKMYIENISTSYDDDIIPATDTLFQIMFMIFKKTGYYAERKGIINVTCVSDTKSVELIQIEYSDTSSKKITDRDIDKKKISVAGIVPNSYYSNMITSITNLRYDYNYLMWLADVSVTRNSKKILNHELMVNSYPKTISHNAQYLEVIWFIITGELNSSPRYGRIKFSIPDYKCEDYYDLTQAGSTDAQGTKFDKNYLTKSKLYNISDNIVSSSTTAVDGPGKISLNGNFYIGTIKINENSNHNNTVAYIKPTEISDWSVSDFDNYNNAAFYIRIKGKNVYIGIDRNVKIKIEIAGIGSKEDTILQEKAPSVDSNTLANVTDLDVSSIKISGEATTNKLPYLITDEMYCVPITLNKNDVPTKYDYDVVVGSREYSGSFGYGNYDDVSLTPEYSIPNYDNMYTVVTSWWRRQGEEKTRTVKLSVDGIAQTITNTWTGIKYQGDQTYRSNLSEDYSLTLSDYNQQWISLNQNNLISSSNSTSSTRKLGLTDTLYLDDSKQKNLKLTLKQEPRGTSVNFLFSSSLESGTTKYLNATDSASFMVYSLDDDLMQPLDISWTPAKFNNMILSCTHNDYWYKFTVAPTSLNISNANRTWQVSFTQATSGKKISLTFVQHCYQFSLDNTSINITPNVEVAINVTSLKSGNFFGFTWDALPNWVMVYRTSDTKLTFKCIEINDSTKTRSCTIRFTQYESGISKTLTISEESWRNPELDESTVDLYYKGAKSVKELYSDQAGVGLPITIRQSDGTLDSTKIKLTSRNISDSQYAIDIVSLSDLEGTIPLVGRYALSNKNQYLGEIYCIMHAYQFNCSSDNTSEIVWTLSPKANELWSMYYVTSRIDGEFTDYEISKAVGDFTCYHSGANITILPKFTNYDNERKNWSLTLKQNKTKKEIPVKVQQLGANEYEDIYI